MPRRVFVVQHGEKVGSTGDPDLTERGRRQAAAVAQRLAALGPIALFSSPAKRATTTAETVMAGLPCPAGLVIDHRFRERMDWGGSESGQSLADFLSEWSHCTIDRHYRPVMGDSSVVAGSRMLEALREAVQGACEWPLVVVSHGVVTVDLLRSTVGDAVVESIAPGVVECGMPGGSITELLLDGPRVSVVNIADVGHLSDEDRSGHVPGWPFGSLNPR